MNYGKIPSMPKPLFYIVDKNIPLIKKKFEKNRKNRKIKKLCAENFFI